MEVEEGWKDQLRKGREDGVREGKWGGRANTKDHCEAI